VIIALGILIDQKEKENEREKRRFPKNPTNCREFVKVQIPPTQLVDRSYLAYKVPVAGYVPIPPTQLVDRSYLAYGRKRPGFSESHQLHGGK
jgi:hypothetical protein